MNLFRLVLCLAGVALYFVIRGTGSWPAEAGKPAPTRPAQPLSGDPSCDSTAPHVTSHIEILQPSNALAVRKPAEPGGSNSAR
jgi:hypothetical protein